MSVLRSANLIRLASYIGPQARNFSSSLSRYKELRLAIIGQSVFGQEVYSLLRRQGRNVVGVFTVPDDANGRPDPLAAQAEKDGTPVFKIPRWRKKGALLPDVFEQYRSVQATLNVLPFCTQFIPMEVIDGAQEGSIIYHPSILPKHRGASAINWTLMQGDHEAGFTIFWADDGLDTGPILLQRTCTVDINDTVDTLYNRFLFPEGVRAMGEAVRLIEEDRAPRMIQWEGGSTYDQLWQKKDLAKIDWDKSALDIHNFIRGNDKIPGAWAMIDKQKVTLYGSSFIDDSLPVEGREVEIEGLSSRPAVIANNGLVAYGSDGKKICVTQLQLEDGRMIRSTQWGKEEKVEKLELTPQEELLKEKLGDIWKSILSSSTIEEHTDFFKSGASSMDVTRLIEEVKELCDVTMTNDDVYMCPCFLDFTNEIVRRSRGGGQETKFEYDSVTVEANGRSLQFPHQLFVNGEFVNSSWEKDYDCINPTDESVICQIQSASVDDVNTAVKAAKYAFEEGEWGKVNARDRGDLMYRLADLMEEHKEELATLESMDSGAVYTLALKTHIGFSIDSLRYFAGWCDKIQGKTIPINHARPSRNLSFTKREPIGVCGIVIPWNYPLMMLAWKISPCLAAGNTVVLKPAQVTPLTALKFAELSARAGFPKGVINILPGKGSIVGQALSDHLDVRKIGFTGSTDIGKGIMKSCAESNVKRVSLELGGKSPLIIFSDCDLDKAVRQSLGAVFFNKGENCIAAGRLFVERKIHDEFMERVVEEVKKMKIGDPLDRSVSHGPQNHKAHLDSLLEYIRVGVEEGASLVYGGKRVQRSGYFLEPTVFTNVEDHMMIAREESFGPVMVVSVFENGDVDGVVRRANATEFGLASGVFTSDINKAMRVSERIQAGTCFVNCYNKTDTAAPFGGFKQSGFGKDLGEEALHEYLRTKVITVEY